MSSQSDKTRPSWFWILLRVYVDCAHFVDLRKWLLQSFLDGPIGGSEHALLTQSDVAGEKENILERSMTEEICCREPYVQMVEKQRGGTRRRRLVYCRKSSRKRERNGEIVLTVCVCVCVCGKGIYKSLS